MTTAKQGEELAEYEQTTQPGWFDGTKLHRNKGATAILRLPESRVPSITWNPLNEPARRALARRMAAHTAHVEGKRAAHEANNPVWIMKQIAAGGIDVSGLKKNLASDAQVREQAATIAEMKAELEELRGKTSAPTPPPAAEPTPEKQEKPAAQGVQGGSVGASTKK
jgi:hypothetical protein